MLLDAILPLLLIHTSLAFPQNIQLPEIKNVSPPEEVNALAPHSQFQRSIDDHVQVQNTEDTIKEVEALISSNPELPRLTRGEILDILENITKQDQNNFVDSVREENHRDAKAVMVVKAYTPLGSGEVNMEELFTKPPITSIIDNDNEFEEKRTPISTSTSPRTTTGTNPPHFRRKPTKTSEDKKVTSVEKKKPQRDNVQFKIPATTSTARTTSPRITTTTTTSTTLSPSTTRKYIKRRRRPPATTTEAAKTLVTTFHPRRRVPLRTEMKYTNHKYPEESNTGPTLPSNGIRVVDAPKFIPSEINSELEDLLPQEGGNQESIMPVSSHSQDNSVSEPSIELEIPDHLKKVVADLNLAAIKDPESFSLTSIVPTSEKTEAEKIKDILASIGVLPPSIITTTTTEAPNAKNVVDNLSPDMQELLKSFGLLPESEKDQKNDVSSFNPEKAEIHPESYVGFKPLPEDSDSRKEMEDLLEQFGLLDKNNRNSKALKKDASKSSPSLDLKKDIKIEQISLDVVPDDLKPILREMGLAPERRQERKIREQPVQKSAGKDDVQKKVEKQHVFNPAESQYATEEEMEKLGRLLEIVKKLETLNGSYTEEDMKQIDTNELNELISSLNPHRNEKIVPLNEQNGPDPVHYDFGLSKNEVKRQESTTDNAAKTEASSPSEAPSDSPSEAPSEEAKTPSIKDLEDSFGGSAVTEPPEPESTTARSSGFYYLLDWNSFFEIDDQKGKRVNLRFQPKVGDPKRFFSVTVP